MLALAGCTISPFKAERVHFFDRAHDQRESDAVRVQIFMDAQGDLYPKDGLPASLRKGTVEAQGDLRWMADGGSDALCAERGSGSTETDRLCEAVQSDDGWVSAQAAMWTDRAERIAAEAVSGNGYRPIVMLIHGFNVTDARPDYGRLRQAVVDVPMADAPLFVEVNWNGYRRAAFDRAWDEGQGSGPLVGFELRQLLNNLAASLEGAETLPTVHVLTHSSGAFVAGAMLGNPCHALPNLRDLNRRHGKYAAFYKNRATTEGLHAVPKGLDIRVGMLAPATSALTFVESGDCGSEGEGVADQRTGLRTEGAVILSSLNTKDRALRKAILPVEMTWIGGATGLGANPAQACELAAEAPAGTEVAIYDFTPKKGTAAPSDSHAIATYLAHPVADMFIRDLLLTNDPTGAFDGDCASLLAD